jgi:hypothetical protein
VQLAAWKPTRVGLLLLSLAVGPSLTEPLSFSSRARVGRPREQPWPRVSLPGLADEQVPLVGDELDLNRIETDFLGISIQIEVSQPYIS